MKVRTIQTAGATMSEQYEVSYQYIDEDGWTCKHSQIYCVTNSKCAHKQVKAYAYKLISQLYNDVKILSVNYL